MNQFDAYRLPVGLTEGVDIPLPSTSGKPAVFHVILPSNSNEEFTSKLMASLNYDPDTNKINGITFAKAKRDLFFSECILSASGLPDGMSIDVFFETYPLAKRPIYERAVELALQADQEIEAALEKLQPLRNGRSSGEASTSNTTSSKSKAASSKPVAPSLGH